MQPFLSILFLGLVANSCLIAQQVAVRQVIGFNSGWKFVKADEVKKEIDPQYRLSNNDLKIVSVSSEETNGENSEAKNIIDGKPETFWRTQYKDQKTSFPHSVVIDLGKVYDLDGFSYLGRQNSPKGWIKDFELYLSTDNTQWGSPVTKGSFASNSDLQLFAFPKTQSGRFVKVVALSSYSPEFTFATLAEIGFIKGDKSADKSNWMHQFSVVHTKSDGSTQQPTKEEKNLTDELSKLRMRTWEKVTLPHTANIEPRIATNEWEGICYYKKEFTINPLFKGKKVTLTFNGAMQIADIWLDGKYLMRHTGGYLPFSIDLSDLNFSQKHTIVLKLDNKPNSDVPPGKPMKNLDFNYYSGIYRDVNMTISNPVFITDPIQANKVAGGGIFVTYNNVSPQSAIVNIQTNVQNESAKNQMIEIIQSLIDKSGKTVATAKSQPITLTQQSDNTIHQSIKVTNPKLWSPDEPNLYTLQTAVLANKKLVDQVKTRIGVRWFEFTKTDGSKINGKDVVWNGTNRHQEYPYLGNALTHDAQYRDLQKIKNAGFNSVRLAHYPQDPSVLDACDELGLLVEHPIAGWQFFNNSDAFKEHTYKDIREYIRRDRNHACIALWETNLNESYPPTEFVNRCIDIAHEEFPGKQCFTAGDSYGYKVSDGLKWDVPHNTFEITETNILRPQTAEPDAPGVVREYGDYEFGGHYSTTRVMLGEGEKGLLQNAWNFIWEYNYICSLYPATIGGLTWLMYDANRGAELNLCASGASDINRLPKFVYYFFQSQRNPTPIYKNPAIENGPMAFITNYWTPRDKDKVVVFSNCDEIELFVNGRSVARQRPDNGPDSEYGKLYKGGNPFDGGNCKHLSHPPFTFNNIAWEAGEIKAVGYLKGEKVTEYSVKTPEEPMKIVLKADYSGRKLKADGADAIFVYATIVDKNGTPCAQKTLSVKFKLTGEAKLISPATVDTEAGIATALIQATEKPGNITVTATMPDGQQSSLRVVSVN